MLRIKDPFHGAVLNYRHGTVQDGQLTITVTGDWPGHGSVEVNGVPATVTGDGFSAQVPLAERETDIVAVYSGIYGRQEHRVRVVWDKHSFPRYRFSIDDNSFFLRDIARKGYDSLFDCFYTDMLRRLNREYGTKFTLNIYYEADDGWLLTEFPDKYRAEWEACADWLGLTFHAYANLPDRPYQYASPEKLLADRALVHEQIARLAGEQTLIPETVIHWGMVLPEALPELRKAGVKVLSGFSHPCSYGYDVHYWMDEVRSEYLYRHDAIKDFPTDLVFSRVDIVCNNTPVDRVAPTLEPLSQNPDTAEIMDLFTHEQYFWDFYHNYIPDHPQRVETAIRWVTDHGYKPVFYHEGFLGAPE